MLFVEKLDLPKTLPQPDAIRSWGTNEWSYDPEVWEFQYQRYRYLGRVKDDELAVRYRDIQRNMQALTSPDRDVIPIHSFLSSWYWFRKEHQTRFEFSLRNLPVPHKALEGAITEPAIVAPARPRSPNSADILFRYDTVGGPDYFVWCASCDWDSKLYGEFTADACVVIRDPTEFARRLKAAADAELADWYFHHNPVEYYDPYEETRNRYISSGMSKDFRFAYQREYRFSWQVCGVKRRPDTNFSILDHCGISLTCRRFQSSSAPHTLSTKLSTTRCSPAWSQRIVSLVSRSRRSRCFTSHRVHPNSGLPEFGRVTSRPTSETSDFG